MGEGVANVLKAIVQEKVGKKAVGDGECFALVDMALKSAGAKSAEDFGKVTRNSDYIWGHAVGLDHIRPGDVLQFRNHVVKVRTETDTAWKERTYTRPYHTAVVVAVEGDGSVIVVEQKVKPDPKKVTRMSLRALPKERRRDRVPWSRMVSSTTQRSLLPSQVSSRRIGRYRNRRGRRFSSGISHLLVPQGRCSHATSRARADRSIDRGQSAQPRKIGVSPPPISLSNPGFARGVTCVREGVVAGESLGHGPQKVAGQAAARPVPKLPQHAGVGGRSARRPGASPGSWACQAGNEYPIETAPGDSSTMCGLLQAWATGGLHLGPYRHFHLPGLR